MIHSKQFKNSKPQASQSKEADESNENSEEEKRKVLNKCMTTTFQLEGLSYTIGNFFFYAYNSLEQSLYLFFILDCYFRNFFSLKNFLINDVGRIQ